MKQNSSAGRKLLVAALLASAGAGLPQVAFAQESAETSVSNTEIIVTAQRREERAQDVPIVITAVSAEGLRERSITDLQGMQNQIPSLIVAPNGQSTRDTMSPTIRGQGASFQGSPGVVVYMNEVPLITGYSINSQGGPGNFVDLQNVQVLSGVQGTLFGRNTTGGAMLLTSAKPTDKLEGYISGGLGNYNLTELEAVVNVPLSDTLAVRLVGASRDRDGFTQDVNWNKDRDDTHWRMGRVGVQWNPTDTISSYTMAQYGYSKTNGTSSILEGFNFKLYNGYGLCASPSTFCTTAQTILDDQAERGPRKIAAGVDSFMKNETWSVMNSTDFEITSKVKLRNIVSYSETTVFYANDQDGTVLNIYNIGNTALSRTTPKENHKLFTEELQLQGEGLDKKLNYTVGAFYAKQSPKGPMKDFSTNFCTRPGEAGSVACAGYREYNVSNESKALFAQATLDLGVLTPALENLRLTGGYRHTWDHVKGSSVGFTPYYGILTGVNAGKTGCNTKNLFPAIEDAYSVCSFSADLKSNAGNWLIGLDYQPVDNLLLYAKVTRGYKAGGFNSYAVNEAYQTFGPEYVTDYEAGFKSDFTVADRPVRFNLNAYNMDYSKIQRGLSDRNSDGKSGAATVSTASARIRGVEIDAMFKPVDAIEIGGNYSYIDAKYKSFKFRSATAAYDCNSQSSALDQKTVPGTTDAAIADLTCIPLQYLSPHIFSVYGRVQLPVPESAGEVSLFVNYAWRDKQHTSPNNLEKFPNGEVWEPGVVLPSYGVMSANLTWKDFLQSGLEVSAFGTNLTNKTYKISNGGTFNSVGAQTVMYGEPRMYGVRLKYAFGN